MKLNSRKWGGVECWLVLAGLTATGLAVAAPADAPRGQAASDDSSNPYSIIVERNVFHLNPPPPPPEPEKPKLELPVVKITGMVEMRGQEKVLFSATSKADKDTHYYSLTEGQKSEDSKLELVKIHPSKDAVDVMNDGVLVTLTVKDDSPSAPAGSPAPAGGPAAAPHPGPPGPPGPAGRPMFGRALPNLPGGLAYPMRQRRPPQ